MNQYHVYRAIGHGKCSTVYKGRKKKSVTYLAIKSVDRSQKSKVLQEVKILHSLDHPNVLKFYSWYETSAHLWLVLEYCVGGDLFALLKQDQQLPEDSIHDLACGIVRALQFLHSKGILYCDLKPSNILLDENGQTKLCDFGLARKFTAVSKTPISSLPHAKRGTPFYMAPELFQEGGTHSHASDFWALGCVLYECYAGKPPFVGKELTRVIKSIIYDPVPNLPGSPSRSFLNLISSLLVKNPSERIQWPELCEHVFWKTKFILSPQLASTTTVEVHQKMPPTEHSGNSTPHSATPPRHRERGVGAHSKHDDDDPGKDSKTPSKASPQCGQRKACINNKTGTDKNSKGVNVLRLSRIAKSNLQKENDKENYRRPLPNTLENDDADVNVENTDMELDFNENAEDEVQDEASESCNGSTSEVQEHGTVSEQSNSTNEPVEKTLPFSSPSPCVSPQIKPRRGTITTTTTTAEDHSSSPHELDSPSSPATHLLQFFWHPTDFSVRPVMPSRKADKMSVEQPGPSLPFDPLPASEFSKLSGERSDDLGGKIASVLNGNAAVTEKQSVMRYLEIAGCSTDPANVLTNGPVMPALVKILRQSKASSPLRVQAVSVIGMLFRHSTFISEELAGSGILRCLADGLGDKQEKVRRFSMAALGELLFYIATQDDHAANPLESPSKHNRAPSSSSWQVSSSLISLVSSLLRKGEDDVTQLYALKTIENICSQGAAWASRFSSQDVMTNLCCIFRASGKQEAIRVTAGSCLARLVCFIPSSGIQSVMERIPFRDLVFAFLKASSPREQQVCLNLLSATASSGNAQYTAPSLSPAEDKSLVTCLASLVEQGSEILRGKSLVLAGFLCKNGGRRWLSHFFGGGQKLLSTVDRLLSKDRDQYVQQCLQSFVGIAASLVPGLLEAVTADVRQTMSGTKKLPTGRTPRAHVLPVLVHLLGTPAVRLQAMDQALLQQLADLLNLLEGRDDFQALPLLRLAELASEQPCLVLQNPAAWRRISHALIAFFGVRDGNARFLCLKILFDVVVLLLEAGGPLLPELVSSCGDRLVALCAAAMADEDPIPLYAQKLLLMLAESGHVRMADVLAHQPATVPRCFDCLVRGDLAAVNVCSVRLCLAVASVPELETSALSELKPVRRVARLLEFVHAREMEDFLEPVLALCIVFVKRSAAGFPSIKDMGGSIGLLVELSASPRPDVADAASECALLLLAAAAPREAATGLLTNHLPRMTATLAFLSSSAPSPVLCRMLHSLAHACRQCVSQGMILSIPAQEITKIEAIVSGLRTSAVQTVSEAAQLAASSLRPLAPYV